MDNNVEFNGESHEIPEHIMVQVGEGYTIDNAKEDTVKGLQNLYGSTETAETVETTAATEVVTDETAKVAETTETAVTETETSTETAKEEVKPVNDWFKRFDFESEEAAEAVIKKAKDIEEVEKTVKHKEAFWKEVESPFANDKWAARNEFAKKYDFDNVTVIDNILFSTKESLKEDPILALAIAKVIDNPDTLKTFDFEAVKGRIERQYTAQGVDFTDKESDSFKDLQMEAFEKMQNIEKFREGLGTGSNAFATLQENRQKTESLVADKVKSAQTQISNLGLTTLELSFGDEKNPQKISLEAPKELLKEIPETVVRQLSLNYDLSTSEGKQQFNDAVTNYLITKNFRSFVAKAADEGYTRGLADKKAQIEQIKDNGQPVVHGKSKEATSSQKTEIQSEIESVWKVGQQ